MSHGAAACASRLTHIGTPLPAVATDNATAKHTARRAVGAREKCIIVLAKDNTTDRVLFLLTPSTSKSTGQSERQTTRRARRRTRRRKPTRDGATYERHP